MVTGLLRPPFVAGARGLCHCRHQVTEPRQVPGRDLSRDPPSFGNVEVTLSGPSPHRLGPCEVLDENGHRKTAAVVDLDTLSGMASSRRSTVPDGAFCARARSGTPSRCWTSRCGQDSIPARSRYGEPTWLASRCTSHSGYPAWPVRARCSCRAPSPTLSRALASNSRTGASTNSRVSPGPGTSTRSLLDGPLRTCLIHGLGGAERLGRDTATVPPMAAVLDLSGFPDGTPVADDRCARRQHPRGAPLGGAVSAARWPAPGYRQRRGGRPSCRQLGPGGRHRRAVRVQRGNRESQAEARPKAVDRTRIVWK